MDYLNIEEYTKERETQLQIKLLEEMTEYFEASKKDDIEHTISELHDIAQVANTIIFKLCGENDINYDDTLNKHKEKIKGRI